MADEVVLLDFWPIPSAMTVPIALGLKGIEYEYKDEDLWNKSPLILQMNPVHKKIPVLFHNGKPICDSLVAVQYIDEVRKDKSPLLPSDPYQRAQTRFWADYVDKKIYDVGGKLWTTKGEEQEAASKEFIEHLKLLEEQLGDKKYFGGDNLNLVDVALVPFYSWFEAYKTFGNIKIEAECPKFFAWANRCLQNESVSNSLPDQYKVYDFVLQSRKKLGMGDDPSFVDLALVPFYSWFDETLGNIKIEAECSKFIAWAKRCLLNESVSMSLPDQHKVYDFLVQMKTFFGIESAEDEMIIGD